MIKSRPLRSTTGFFVLCLLTLSSSSSLLAQTFATPISGSIYGQPIVACSSNGLYESAATDAAVYARLAGKNDYYISVYTAPGALQIVSSSETRISGLGYRGVLLHDGGGNFYVVYNKIKAPYADSIITGPTILPPPYSGKYMSIVAGRALYVYSMQVGGPPGNITVSRDNGLTWHPDTGGIQYDDVYDYAVDTEQDVIMAGATGIYKQLPTDSVWALLNPNAFNATKIFVDQSNRIVTGGYAPSTYISIDGGATFNPDTNGLTGEVQYFAGDAYGNLYTVTSTAPLYRNVGGTGLWVDIATGLNITVGSDIRISCISGDSLLTIGTSNYGMYTSSDKGITFSATNNGIHAEDIYSIITQPDGRLLCTTDLGIFYKDAADTLWHATNPITSFYPGYFLYNDNQGTIYVAVGPTAGSPYPLGKSTDNGLNFAVDSAGFSAIGGSGFYIDETGTKYFYNYYASGTDPLTIWKSPQGSSTWSPDSSGLPLFPIYGTGVKDMCDDQLGYLYASVDMPGGDIIYRRPVTGTTWMVDTTGLGASDIIAPMAANASLGIIITNGTQLYRRTGNGWVNIPIVPAPDDTGMFSQGGINALSVDNNGIIYFAFGNNSAPDSSAVFFSKDTGATWQLAGLMGMSINNLVSTGDTTYALTYGRWGFVLTGKAIAGVKQLAETGEGIKVFPNPSISGLWTLQAGSEWAGSRIEICDIDGKMVYGGVINNTIAQISMPGLSHGIYMLCIFNGGNSATRFLVK